MRDIFCGYHPAANFLYFATVLTFAMTLTHPICLAVSFVCAFSYSVYLGGKKALRFNLMYMLPMLVFTAVLNPAFNHQGATVLMYLPSGNPLTLESISYGAAAAIMLITVIAWFSCLNAVMTSDKFVYMFGRIVPALSLIMSMSLRFAPRLISQIKIISNAQKCIGRDMSSVGIIQKAKRGIKILSILVTWALENAIETSDSMKGRGYGLSGRTAFSIFHFDRRDATAIGVTIVFAVYVIVGRITGGLTWRYFPTFRWEIDGIYAVSLFAAYFLLCALPILLNVLEGFLWKASISKI